MSFIRPLVKLSQSQMAASVLTQLKYGLSSLVGVVAVPNRQNCIPCIHGFWIRQWRKFLKRK